MRMRDVINQSMIWKLVGSVTAINGLVCFGLSSTYNMTFGKLDVGGPFVYLFVGLITWYLIIWGKRIQVSEKVQGLVVALIFVVICLMSVVHDKLVTAKSDALSIISYGSFALMSLCASRKLDLGFETGFSTFFLKLFAAQLFKINSILLPIALVFCSLIIILRHSSASNRVQYCPPITQNQTESCHGVAVDIHEHEDANERQYSPSNNGQVSDRSLLLDWYNQLNNEQEEEEGETGSSFPAESWGQDRVPSGNNQNGRMHSFLPWELLRRRQRLRMRLRAGIQNMSSRVGGRCPGRWPPSFFFPRVESHAP